MEQAVIAQLTNQNPKLKHAVPSIDLLFSPQFPRKQYRTGMLLEGYTGQWLSVETDVTVNLTNLSSLDRTFLKTHLPCSLEVFPAGKQDSWVERHIRHTGQNLLQNVPHYWWR